MKEKYGQESIFLWQQWEKLEKKMADYRNYLRFTMKCLKNEIKPVSVRLRTNVQMSRGLQIIRKAEKQLLNSVHKIYKQHTRIAHFEEKYMFRKIERYII